MSPNIHRPLRHHRSLPRRSPIAFWLQWPPAAVPVVPVAALPVPVAPDTEHAARPRFWADAP